MVDDMHHKTFSQDPSPQILYKYLSENFPGANYYSAYEAGFCGFWIHDELQKLGVKCIVVNPADIPTTGKETIQKEDKRDSLKIVKCLRGGMLNPIYVPSQHALESRSLLRVRTAIVKDVARTKKRLKNHLYLYGIHIPRELQKQSIAWTRTYLEWLRSLDLSATSRKTVDMYLEIGQQMIAHKKEITRQLRAVTESDQYKKNYELLLSIPGIGVVNAITLLLEVDRFDRFENAERFCSYIGLVPSTRSSGEREKTGDITPRGNKLLRRALIEAAWKAACKDPALMMKFKRFEKRMNKNQATVRIAKALAARILYVMKNQTPYRLGTVN